MKNSASQATDRKTYQTPEVKTYTEAEVLELIGPAVANYGITPKH